MGTLQGKTVWITGASSGIGEALARVCWDAGASLVLSARREGELNRIAGCLSPSEGRTVMTLPMDISDTVSAVRAAEAVIARFGSVDVLINNAGVSQRSFVKDTPLEVDRRIMEVNFFGTVALTKAVLPNMIARRAGMVVVISSISGKFGFYLRSAYSASKHALHGFFESLRLEVYRDNVDVLLVCPGKVRTGISLSALRADGQPHGEMDEGQEKGISADACATRILRGILHREEEVHVGGPEMKALWIKRFFPGIFSRLIRRQKVE